LQTLSVTVYIIILSLM